METKEILEYAETHKDTLPLVELRQLAGTLHSQMRTMPPNEWKRVQALQDYIRNKLPLR